MEDRLVGSEVKFEDSSLEGGLRPQNLSGYIGQKTVIDNIKIYIEAAKRNDRQLDHLLLAGPPGLGKTTLSQIVANEMGVKIFITSGPAIEKKGDLAGLLTSLKEKDVLFIDEIHRLNASVEESLYSAMEDFFFDIMLGEGAHAKSMRLPIEPFTLIGATTKTGSLSSPLRDRFQIVFRMDYYSVEELKKIVERSSEILGIKTSSEGALEIARRARGTPRIANRILKRIRDFAEIKGDGTIGLDITRYALDQMEIDEDGLDQMDRTILLTIIESFNCGPVGVESIAASVSEEKRTLEEVYEPYLIKSGFIARTPKGRVVTKKTLEKFGIENTFQGKLF
ncbi:MAG TPA: Holliday junction branch migration DNA helicase RuvB [bacterium]|nr:Holliday junction branch migration DNA helicase RuvB [bacterium]MDX9805239.1 Holliday junction branch migration DNA helicase RuvB [bacterium]HNW15546.1 Holliday junction branch migration DNA helicase RuvB [bacterium]HNZ53607.1 Holliday junction branch migration DNA helicase RuvB [bacterium]HOB71465.1 Holliday junction branch migration DNA helicase RuvB [bacterium]